MPRIIISSGHNEKEPGAVSGDLKEADLTKKIASKVTSKLRSEGIVVLSVPPELDLDQKIKWINNTGFTADADDACIEFHINQGGKTGIEGWHKNNEEKSKELTTSIVENICDITGLTNQGIKDESEHTLNSLAFLSETKPISSLIECLYIDNEQDQAFLRDDRKLDELAEGIVEGIIDYLGEEDEQPATIQNQQNAPNAGMRSNLNANPRAGSSFNRSPSMGGGFPSVNTNRPKPSTPSSLGAPYNNFGSFNSSGGVNSPYKSPATTQNQNMTTEQRKEMIREKYQQILGRKVNDQDLNYFVNLGLTESQMVKRLVESQEHVDLVKNGREYKDIKPKYDKLKTEVEQLKVFLDDKEKIIAQQNELIAQKNKSIHHLQQGSVSPEQQTQSNTNFQNQVTPKNQNYSEVPQQKKEGFIDKILRRLNDIFD